jgi:hypothetical protein
MKLLGLRIMYEDEYQDLVKNPDQRVLELTNTLEFTKTELMREQAFVRVLLQREGRITF